MTAEFALALILLVGAGLLIRSFANLLETNPGFRPDHVLTLNIPLPRAAYPRAAQIEDFYKQSVERVSNLSGVRAAGVSSDLPLNASEIVSMIVEGGEGENKTPQAICQSWVLGDYIQTMGIPLRRGHAFGPEDRLETQPVAMVSQSFARKFWPSQDAIGKRLRWGVRDPWDPGIGQSCAPVGLPGSLPGALPQVGKPIAGPLPAMESVTESGVPFPDFVGKISSCSDREGHDGMCRVFLRVSCKATSTYHKQVLHVVCPAE